MNKELLRDRTKNFGLRVIKLVDSLPKTTSGYVVAKQLMRSGTSVGANYRAACMGKSRADFVAKLGIVLEEIDESCFWLEIIIESGLMAENKADLLYKEAKELTAIFMASIKTSKSK